MAYNNGSQYPDSSGYQAQMSNLPPVQTQHPPRPTSYSPSPYGASPWQQHSPSAMDHPSKRQRLSPSNATSPYSNSPYATSPPNSQYLSLPGTPSAMPTPYNSFHQPQPYYQPPNPSPYQQPQQPAQGVMGPPRIPASKANDDAQLEKVDPKATDIGAISDALTGTGVDIRAEEDAMLGFKNWSGLQDHGAFRGTGPLSNAVTEQDQQKELEEKRRKAARLYSEATSQPLTDPFLTGNLIRKKLSIRTYEHGIGANLEGVYDRIADRPQNIQRTAYGSPALDESVARLQSDSLINKGAGFVELLSLISLAAEERVRTVLEDAYGLARTRELTSQGTVPPEFADIAAANAKNSKPATATPENISGSSWEEPTSGVSPHAKPAEKRDFTAPNGAPPTPPTDGPPTPKPTVKMINHLTNELKRRALQDKKWEEERIAKRKKREAAKKGAPEPEPVVAPLPIPEKLTKKERDRLQKGDQSEEAQHRKANETASMALGGLGGKKKYSWMTGGGGGGMGGGLGSGASTPRRAPAATTPKAAPETPQVEKALQGKMRDWQGYQEPARIQLRDVVHVLEQDGQERKTLASILSRMKSTENEGQSTLIPASRIAG